MKRFLFILFSLHIAVAAAQPLPILTDQLIIPSKEQVVKNYDEYDFGAYILYNGTDDNGKYFYITDKANGNKIFEFEERESKARRFIPKFFQSDQSPRITIICMSLEGNYSWGTHIFIMDKSAVYHAGFLPYGADNFNFSALGLYCQFEQRKDSFVMFFQPDVKIIDYATDDILDGEALEFTITRNNITRTK